MIKYFTIPDKCPACGAPTKIISSEGADILVCSNPTCPGKVLNKLVHFCGKDGLDIKFLGERVLDDLMEYGFIETYSDIFNLKDKRAEWIKKEGYQSRGVDRILEEIENSRTNTFDKFLSSIGIPLIGRGVAKQLAQNIPDYDTFRNLVDSCYNFGALPNFGDAKESAILEFDYSEADEVYKLLTIMNDSFITEEGNKPCDGLTFVITGSLKNYKNRNELVDIIEKNGGKVSSSVSRNTDYLINNDITSTSGKNKTAKDLGVPIISEDDFIAKFLI